MVTQKVSFLVFRIQIMFGMEDYFLNWNIQRHVYWYQRDYDLKIQNSHGL